MATRRVVDSCRVNGFLDGTLHDRLVQMVAVHHSGPAFEMEPGRRKKPLPAPLLWRVRKFADQGARQGRAAASALEIRLMETAFQVTAQDLAADGPAAD